MPTGQVTPTRLELHAGEVVEVRSAAEILATLDENGELDSLPFMPEMLRYCGQRMTVYKVAHKTCDTLTRSGMRRMENVVHLTGARCDGAAHGGCQAACMMFWKHAWLRKVDPAEAATRNAEPPPDAQSAIPPLLTIASRGPVTDDGEETYRCQATELLRAAPKQVRLRDLGQFVDDVRTGNAGVLWTLRTFIVMLYNRVQSHSSRFLPAKLRWRGGRYWGYLRGRATGKTPTVITDLRPGDLVRVKSKQEIEPTLNSDLLNRGMGFDAEMARFCGRTARVARRIDHIIDERTGRMLHMKNPCIVLEGVICEGAYNVSCPRAITPYWREVWLEKVENSAAPASREDHTAAADPAATR